MHDLRAADYARIGRFIASLDPVEVPGEEPFPRQFLAELRGLVACERVQFCELDRVRQRELGSVTEPLYDEPWRGVTYWDVRHEHPLCRHQDETFDFTARKLSDFVSLAQLRKTRIYAQWFRPLGQERLLTVGLDAPLRHTKLFLFSRPGGRDFTERDRTVLDVVRPWLAERYSAWAAHRRVVDLHHPVEARGGADVVLEQQAPASGLTPREQEILALVGEGKTNREIAEQLWISAGTVRRHLENVYAKLGVHTRTGAVRANHLQARGL